jgi:hypothetical protein
MTLRFAGRATPFLLAAAACLGLAAAGCGLDKVEDSPLIGPSETGISVDLQATPDTLNADGVSSATVQLVLRHSDGTAYSGLAVYFSHDGDGVMSPSPGSTFVGPVQTGLVMATDRDGVARVTYVAGTGIGTVRVYVRPYGIDAANSFERTTEIIQR